MGRLISGLMAIGVMVGWPASGEELARGTVVERVLCAGNAKQSYALYLPTAYSREHTWPILYCLDPGARGRVPVERFAKAAGAAGWIVVGSNNSRNGNPNISREAIDWLVRDTHERFAIDDSHVYAAGFSGGARLALAWARNGQITGVIACGAAFGEGTIPKDATFRVFASAGVDDFNFDEVYGMARDLSRRGVPERFVEFDGGHDWLPEALTAGAIDFLAGRSAPEAPQPPSPVQKKVAERYAFLVSAIQQGTEEERRRTIEGLRRDENLPDDGVNRRVARRVLTGTFVAAMEEGRGLAGEQNYRSAVQAWNLALLIRPDGAEALYGLAVAQAGARDHRKALDALHQAVAHGFRDAGRAEREPAFDSIRRDPRFAAAVEAMKK